MNSGYGFYTEASSSDCEGEGSEDKQSEQKDDGKTNLIVNYLPQSMKDIALQHLFGPFGPIQSLKILRDYKTGYSFGYGFVNFENECDAQKAIEELNGFEIEGKKIKVALARPQGVQDKDTNLYITNLPRSMTEEELEDIFKPHGNIVQRKILFDKITGLPRGVAFVRYSKTEEARAAMNALQGHVLRPGSEGISIKIAEEHGKQKAAYFAGMQVGLQLKQSRGRGGKPHSRFSPFGPGFGPIPPPYMQGPPPLIPPNQRPNYYGPRRGSFRGPHHF